MRPSPNGNATRQLMCGTDTQREVWARKDWKPWKQECLLGVTDWIESPPKESVGRRWGPKPEPQETPTFSLYSQKTSRGVLT